MGREASGALALEPPGLLPGMTMTMKQKRTENPWEGIEPPTGVMKDRMEYIDAQLQKVRKAERRLGLLAPGNTHYPTRRGSAQRADATRGVGSARRADATGARDWPELPSAKAMAEALHTGARTVRRLIEAMQDLYGMPIEYVYAKHGYRYTEDVSFSPLVLF